MTSTNFSIRVSKIKRLIKWAALLSVIYAASLTYLIIDLTTPAEVAIVEAPVDPDLIENGIHMRTGLLEAEGMMSVVTNCTSCHSAKIITQNRMSAERWNETIKWMQETQGLWDLGGNQEIIVNYLVKNYPPTSKGRRMILENIEWYEMEL
ncbi:MAG TPA: monoheme cytochrome C [Bacteroidetes bacterium]|jgi:hypothetical protein|nr:monoheme cytochrome C [Bacteroidota bacterium]|tara:strand:- start:4738 stop:5190 length:453 start_codon:yes stop_codon:yes gene_type:complete